MQRTEGTPQGGVISPLLANLYLNYAFDQWMVRNFPDIPFERYADDIVCHCRTETQAARLKYAIEQRFARCFPELHSQKTKIVYCKNGYRRGNYDTVQFDFLGYTFRPRLVKSKGGIFFVGFTPAISAKSSTAIRQTMRKWRFHLRSDLSLEQIARSLNPIVRGWLNYYGLYYKSALRPVLAHLDAILWRWATRKYKSLKRRRWNAQRWLNGVAKRQRGLFEHWRAFRAVAG